jgi:predicted secreted protein
MSTFIPGYLTVINANSEDITANIEVVDYDQSRNVVNKRLMGSKGTSKVAGKIDRSWSLRGNLTAEQAENFQDIFELDAPFAFTLQIGEGAGATDSGLYSGNAIAASYRITGNADGDYSINLDLQAHGDVTYTPAA